MGQPCHAGGRSGQCCRCVQPVSQVCQANYGGGFSQCCRCVQLVLREWPTIGAGVSPSERVRPTSDAGVPSQRSRQARPVMQVCTVSVAIVSSQPVLEVQLASVVCPANDERVSGQRSRRIRPMNSKDKTRHIHFPHSTVDSDYNYTKLVSASRRLNVVDRRLVMHI